MPTRIVALVLAALLWAAPAWAAQAVSNIHNAPGWLHSHAYSPASGPMTRVVNGAGWNEGAGTYNPGSALNAYQLTSVGTCTSAASGGPSGTGSSISDGTCTWKYLSGVDYISISGWSFDAPAWSAQTYQYGVYVVSDAPLRAYMLSDASCASTTAPTGTGVNADNGPIGWGGRNTVTTAGDGCHWTYWSDILYTSQASFMPVQTWGHKPDGTANTNTNHLAADGYKGLLWNDREYVAGSNGETGPIRTQAKTDWTTDYDDTELFPPDCFSVCPRIVLTPAPGESFRDSLTASDALAGYDPTKGVAISNALQYPAVSAGLWAYSQGWSNRDNSNDLINLQIKSAYTSAFNAFDPHGNMASVQNSILEGGPDPEGKYCVGFDSGNSVLSNSLVICHGRIGVMCKYYCTVIHSTIVQVDALAGSIGLQSYSAAYGPNGSLIDNVALFGFTHATAYSSNTGAPIWLAGSANNATDTGSSDSTNLGPGLYGPSYTANPMPGSLYGVSQSATFVGASDFRLKSTSTLRGAGAAYGSFDGACWPNTTACPVPYVFSTDTPDIIGTTRPQSSAYDIGAAQFAGGAPPAPVKGGKIRGGLWH